MEQGDTTASLSYHQAGLALRRQLNDQTGVATVLHNMGLTAHRMGDYEQAIDWLLESISHDEQENALNYAHLVLAQIALAEGRCKWRPIGVNRR